MSNRRIESFLLRLVVEDQDSVDTEAWRGRIQHVGSGYERQFERLQDIVAFIREHFPAAHVLSVSDDETVSDA
jgi:hypothetical protein